MPELAVKARPNLRWIMLIPLCMGGLWFFILELAAPHPRYFLYAPPDDLIPFVPAFIIPYVIWYFYIGICGLALFRKEPGEFCRYVIFLGSGMLIACAVYTFWPNGIELRPDLSGQPGVFNAIIRLLYSIDTPTNSAPSLHTVDSIAAHVAIVRYNKLRGQRRWVAPVSLILCVLIIASTVLIKQHSVIDLVTGLLLAAVLYLAVYRIPRPRPERLTHRRRKSRD